jgi:26S proteasome regulatory subunit T5
MEVDEKPTEDFNQVGGLEKQIEELLEAVVLPITHKERFKSLGIKPPKGVLLFGSPGTGKTLLARACAAQGKATFLKLSAPQLVQVWLPCASPINCVVNTRMSSPTITLLWKQLWAG